LRVAVPGGSYCALHSHAAAEIIYHPTGHGSTRVAGKRQTFGERTVIVHAPGEPHDQSMEVNGEDLFVQIALPARAARQLREGFIISEIDLPWLIEELQHLCQPHHPTPFEQHILNLRATAVLLELIRQAANVSHARSLPAAERHALQAEHYIGRHFATMDSLDEVAVHVGVTPDHLRHVFKKIRGESLVQYLGKIRVARAKTLLTSSPLPLKQIAGLCGFRDEYYFSAAFRRIALISPKQYRRQSAANVEH
jgi:AraC-like DNA-binding protein